MDGNKCPLTEKQRLFNELIKPEICDALESVSKSVYAQPTHVCLTHKLENETESTIERIIYEKQVQDKRVQDKQVALENFINSFEREKKRLPTAEEIL